MKAFLRSVFLALVIVLALAVRPSAGPFEDGEIAYDRGDYATALQLWRPLAEKGHMEAQYSLGVMYADGAGMPRDDAAAHMWFTLAAAQGFGEAQKARDIVVRLMTHGQIEEARLMTREWRAKHQQ